jgi:hypothetical protein
VRILVVRPFCTIDIGRYWRFVQRNVRARAANGGSDGRFNHCSVWRYFRDAGQSEIGNCLTKAERIADAAVACALAPMRTDDLMRYGQ